MLRTALPRPALSSTPSSCSCKRTAATLPTSSSSFPSTPPPIPSVYAQTPAISPPTVDNPHWNDPAYLARYRSPVRHDSGRRFETFANPKPRSEDAPRRPSAQAQRQPRSRENRLEMERLWSGGDFSPPIPDASYKTQTTRPSHALLYPGSGSQYVGMGAFLRDEEGAKEVWDEAEEALATFETWRKGLRLNEMEGELGELGRMLDATEGERSREAGLKQVVFEGPQNELTRSANAQPGILVTSMAFTRALERKHGVPIASTASLILGHSSGEYTSAVAAGALSLGDGVRLTRLHGLLTHFALSLPSIGLSPEVSSPPAVRGGMSALVLNPGHTHQELTEVIRRIRAERPKQRGSEGTVEVASFNSLTQVVLAGSRDGILRASEVLKELEIANRAADLPVSAPFHCSFMKPAAEGMQAALTHSSISIHTPSAPLVSGLDASLITTPSSLISNLVAQISLPVRWSTCIDSLSSKHNIKRLYFLGPGQALANLARKDAKFAREAAVAAGQVPEEAQEGSEVVSVATEKDMERLEERWIEEDGA